MGTPTSSSRFLSLKAAAAELSISMSTIHRWIKTGKLPSIQIGGRRLIPVSALEALETLALDSQKQEEGVDA